MSLSNGTAAMLVSPTNPPGIELYYHANVFFCFGGNTRLLITLVTTLYSQEANNYCFNIYPSEMESPIIRQFLNRGFLPKGGPGLQTREALRTSMSSSLSGRCLLNKYRIIIRINNNLFLSPLHENLNALTIFEVKSIGSQRNISYTFIKLQN